MTDLSAYAAGLLLTALLCVYASCKRHDGALIRSLIAVAGIWVAGASYVAETRIYDPWQLSIALDAMAAAIILRYPAGLFQALLGVLFMLQIAMHVGYGAAKFQGGADEYAYYDSLTYAAWLQLLVLSGWACGRLGQARIRAAWRRCASDFDRAGHKHLHRGGKR